MPKKPAKSLPQPNPSPLLLTGGNPQIPKGDGDAPVQSYFAALPGWKQQYGLQLDTLIVQTVPTVRKAVRWNSPFYGIEGQGWFLSFHCMSKYIKIAFFQGATLVPLPPVESKQKDVRYFHISENDPFATAQLADWIRQSATRPGSECF